MKPEQYRSHGSDGYVKFELTWDKSEIEIPDGLFEELERRRSVLYALGAVGAFPDGVGYGNISARAASTAESRPRFFITGSATGKLERLSREHYALVTAYSLEDNNLRCTGLTKASSESLSHAAVYEAVPRARAVIHIHHQTLWTLHRHRLPTTPDGAEYGTPEMALALRELAARDDVRQRQVIVMGGHEGGLISFGHTLEDATSRLVTLIRRNGER